MNEAMHSRFSPSSMQAELLEQTFVQRHDLARRLVELFLESSEGQSKHHVLLVGPRGIGKSHLAALVYHRLMASEGLASKLSIAWLAEDRVGSSFLPGSLGQGLAGIGIRHQRPIGCRGYRPSKSAPNRCSHSPSAVRPFS